MSHIPSTTQAYVEPGTKSTVFSVALILICAAYAGFFVAAFDLGTYGDPTFSVYGGIMLLVGPSSCALLLWRKSRPFLVTGLLLAVSFLPGVPTLAALVALSVLVMLRRGPWVWTLAAGTAASTVIACLVEAHVGPSATGTSMSLQHGMLSTGSAQPSEASLVALAIAITVMAVMLSVGVGLLRRSRVELTAARTEGEHQKNQKQLIREEMTRQQERERLAREMHDTLAHRLSLAAMHSGSVELFAASDPEAAVESAKGVGDNVRKALDDLRHIMGVMRDPTALVEPSDRSPATLTALPDLIEDSLGVGINVRPVIYLYDAAYAPASVGHVGYRIVQEALTNVHKHAPNATVTLVVRGGPGDGITIHVENPIPPSHGPGSAHPTASVAQLGGGQGLVGMRERASLIGGRLTAGSNGDVFVVDAWLPWPTVST